MAPWIIQIALMAMSIFIETTEGKKDKVLYCSACRAIVDELNYSISQIDPKKTIHVGAFRLNPDGSLTDKKCYNNGWFSNGNSMEDGIPEKLFLCQACLDPSSFFRKCVIDRSLLKPLRLVPLARSETNLSELLDGVCGSMSDYALHVDPDTKKKQYKRFAPRSSDAGDFPDFNNFKFDGPEGSNALKFACESIVEEFEDDIISLFAKETDHVVDKLCNEVSDHCKGTKFQSDEL